VTLDVWLENYNEEIVVNHNIIKVLKWLREEDKPLLLEVPKRELKL